MEILTKTELSLRFTEILSRINQGALFIYPTDTIYGIGCKATDAKAVQKVRELKRQRPTAPFSLCVPSLLWIEKNCVVDKKVKTWLQKLPGPYTLILKLKNKQAIAPNVAPAINTIGIRCPNHWFQQVVEKAGFPIISTSANRTGQPFMTSLENIDSEVEKVIDFMIYEGPKEGKPSKIIDVDKEEIKER